MSTQLKVLSALVVVRLLNAYWIRTYDNPDEYWQAQEVAHRMVFGYGYLTWEWKEHIRSYIHPLLFAGVYKVLQWLSMDNTMALVVAPRLFQGLMAAVTDYNLYTLAIRLFGPTIAPWILFVTLCSWYNGFMAGRTLSNCTEATLTLIALNYWPLTYTSPLSQGSLRKGLCWASLACLIRPTNALVWLFLGVYLLYQSSYRWTIARDAMVVVSLCVAINTLLDTRIYTGSWLAVFSQPVITPLAFFRINVLASISLFYGVHPWHWYLTQGLPAIATTFLPLSLLGYYTQASLHPRIRPLGYLIVWIVAVFSLLSHKEFRFLFPIFPLVLLFAAAGLQHLPYPWRRRVVVGLCITQIPMAFYLTQWHQRGVVDAMLWIRQEAHTQPHPLSVGILMPCHSTPHQSVVHSPRTSLRFLTCEPPLNVGDVDEADEFYKHPGSYLSTLEEWPTHWMMFDTLYQSIGSALPYSECARFFNSHFHDDWRRQGDVVILCKKPVMDNTT
ncbi:GPI mannosyltransferase 3 [Spinellus fusiger]|nr:GPI mannosyltransferase 3 [Spinellus fusiger]